MKRSFPWAVLALAPFLVIALAANIPEIDEFFATSIPPSALAQFLVEYWWSVVAVAVLLHAIGFAMAAFANRALSLRRRILWSVAMVLGAPLVAPIYWWLHSDTGSLGPYNA